MGKKRAHDMLSKGNGPVFALQTFQITSHATNKSCDKDKTYRLDADWALRVSQAFSRRCACALLTDSHSRSHGLTPCLRLCLRLHLLACCVCRRCCCHCYWVGVYPLHASLPPPKGGVILSAERITLPLLGPNWSYDARLHTRNTHTYGMLPMGNFGS